MAVYIVTDPNGFEHRVVVVDRGTTFGHENIPFPIVRGLLTNNGSYLGWTLREERDEDRPEIADE
jgi:hypothetical protein